MNISVILSAHNNAVALRWTLLGYALQSRAPDELIVAQDSEELSVREVVEEARAIAPFPIHLQTQPNQGFRKCLAMNKAIAIAQGDWLIFSDADCLPRNDLVAAYERHARRGAFLAGGSHLNLPQPFHHAQLTEGMIRSQQIFDFAFLRAQGIALDRLRFVRNAGAQSVLNALTARNAFVGGNSGAWKQDLLRIGGFDESMAYGAEDRNVGIRLNLIGVRGIRIRHSLFWLHLDHPRSYAHADTIEKNKRWNAEVRRTRRVLPRTSMLMPASEKISG